MKPRGALGRLAGFLLRGAIRLAPPDAADWGEAMLAELYHVEGDWAALGWAAGGAVVLARQALLAFVMPTRNRPGNSHLKEHAMKRSNLLIGGICLAAALLLFAAPVFRQAFGVSFAQWHGVINSAGSSSWELSNNRHLALESFARRAAKNHDAQALAFVAVRLRSPSESARLADQAVRLDRKLTWVYGILGSRHANAPGVPVWIGKLEVWDPWNALPYLILAERQEIKSYLNHPPASRSLESIDRWRAATSGEFNSTRQEVESYLDRPPAPQSLESNAGWRAAMAGAFNSTKVDDYMDRLRALDRVVARRYHLNDPYTIMDGESGEYGALPHLASSASTRYAKLMIQSGDALRARGKQEPAIAKYLEVARYSQMLSPHLGNPAFLMLVTLKAYNRLAAAYRKMGNAGESAYFSGLEAATKRNLELQRTEWSSRMESRLGIEPSVPRWNAFVVEASNAAMLLSAALLLVAILMILVKSRPLKPGGLRSGRATTALGLAGAAGLLASSVSLYVAYRPYAEIFSQFLRTGDASGFPALRAFLDFTRLPLGTQFWSAVAMAPHGRRFVRPYISVSHFAFYFWLTVTVLGAAGLFGWALRHVFHRFHSHPTTPA